MSTSAASLSRKVFFAGTHRVRPPEQTWARVSARLAQFGITRVADITGLDTIGIPVVMAVRPLAKTLSVSQGKGQSLLLAKVSAVMESIELWHAEHVVLPLVHSRTAAEQLALTYRVTDLTDVPGGLVTERTPLDWVSGTGLTTGAAMPVPRNHVTFQSPQERTWMPPGFIWSSNGLASGNTVPEATLHALYEVVERDAIAALADNEFGIDIDVHTIVAGAEGTLAEFIRRAGVDLAVTYVPSRTAMPCFAVRLWSVDFALTSIGFGAHLAPDVALSRALTEAAQSRLTVIAGSRDDIHPLYHLVHDGRREPVEQRGPGIPWTAVPAPPVEPFEDLDAELAWVGERVTTSVGHEPIVVELGSDEDVSVVKVVVPGMATGLARFRRP